MKTLSKAVAVASLLSAGIMSAQVANADVEYSAGLATTYLWRGTDLGGAAFSGAADYSHESGAYAGLWASSGDATAGNEYDLYVGFAKEFGAVSVDLGAYTYIYNQGQGSGTNGSPGELSEAILNVGIMDASVTYIDNLGDADYSYIGLGYSIAGVDALVGISDNGVGQEYTHLDLSYGLTEELSLTVSKVFDQTTTAAFLAADPANGLVDEDMIVVLSYSIALK
jgi:uncharacterized protein (TIGR02001 family)